MSKRKLLNRIVKCLHGKSEFQMDKSELKIAHLLVKSKLAKFVYIDLHGGYNELRIMEKRNAKA